MTIDKNYLKLFVKKSPIAYMPSKKEPMSVDVLKNKNMNFNGNFQKVNHPSNLHNKPSFLDLCEKKNEKVNRNFSKLKERLK